MHPNPTFRKQSDARNLAFASDMGVGTLAVNGPDGMPLMAHVPFVIEGETVLFHLVRSNPVARALGDGVPGKMFVQGPGSYVSPDWYGLEDQAPTWNYIAVHLAGEVRQLPTEQLRSVLDRLSNHFESQLLPKPIWTADKMSEDQRSKLMRQIVPCVLAISDIQGTWKLGQNKPDNARLAVADELPKHGLGMELAQLADLMRSPPSE
ncbi:FMN-binding negative transcriptional regulator [Thalassovita sp.]|jgi:transcriptional regulator|uniref:FMN-binding negative transcriptional regulator n=1 Tax=Thalassovita sp. TaxID=1979401 RepID=UPI003B5A3CA0